MADDKTNPSSETSEGGVSIFRRVDSFVRGVANGLTFGFADYLAGAGDSVVNGKTVSESIKSEQKETAQRHKEGYEAEAGNVTGMLFGMGKIARAVGWAAKSVGLTGLAEKIIGTAAVAEMPMTGVATGARGAVAATKAGLRLAAKPAGLAWKVGKWTPAVVIATLVAHKGLDYINSSTETPDPALVKLGQLAGLAWESEKGAGRWVYNHAIKPTASAVTNFAEAWAGSANASSNTQTAAGDKPAGTDGAAKPDGQATAAAASKDPVPKAFVSQLQDIDLPGLRVMVNRQSPDTGNYENGNGAGTKYMAVFKQVKPDDEHKGEERWAEIGRVPEPLNPGDRAQAAAAIAAKDGIPAYANAAGQQMQQSVYANPAVAAYVNANRPVNDTPEKVLAHWRALAAQEQAPAAAAPLPQGAVKGWETIPSTDNQVQFSSRNGQTQFQSWEKNRWVDVGGPMSDAKAAEVKREINWHPEQAVSIIENGGYPDSAPRNLLAGIPGTNVAYRYREGGLFQSNKVDFYVAGDQGNPDLMVKKLTLPYKGEGESFIQSLAANPDQAEASILNRAASRNGNTPPAASFTTIRSAQANATVAQPQIQEISGTGGMYGYANRADGQVDLFSLSKEKGGWYQYNTTSKVDLPQVEAGLRRNSAQFQGDTGTPNSPIDLRNLHSQAPAAEPPAEKPPLQEQQARAGNSAAAKKQTSLLLNQGVY